MDITWYLYFITWPYTMNYLHLPGPYTMNYWHLPCSKTKSMNEGSIDLSTGLLCSLVTLAIHITVQLLSGMSIFTTHKMPYHDRNPVGGLGAADVGLLHSWVLLSFFFGYIRMRKKSISGEILRVFYFYFWCVCGGGCNIYIIYIYIFHSYFFMF